LNHKLTIFKRFEFEYAHWLPGYDGPCGSLHGHRAELEVGASGPTDVETGMVMDFKFLKEMVNAYVVNVLDHFCLNNLKDKGIYNFPVDCPTAENTILWIAKVLLPVLPGLSVLRLWETSGSYCEWRA
jgi:6-pyruvoyltetrahydropterin/6-carboxytetrahydropterin synthase